MEPQRGRWRWRGLLTGFVTAALVVSAPASAYAFTAYTGDAYPGLNAATVFGYLDTSNLETDWAFAYGLTPSYGHWSGLGTIPAGQGTVTVAAQLSGLQPATTYHYRLVAMPVISGRVVGAWLATGDDRTVQTEREQLALLATTLDVRHHAAEVELGCISTRPCQGILTLRLSGRSRSCTVTRFAIPSGANQIVAATLGRGCRREIRAAPTHRVAAVLTARLVTGQPPLKEPVTLLGP